MSGTYHASVTVPVCLHEHGRVIRAVDTAQRAAAWQHSFETTPDEKHDTEYSFEMNPERNMGRDSKYNLGGHKFITLVLHKFVTHQGSFPPQINLKWHEQEYQIEEALSRNDDTQLTVHWNVHSPSTLWQGVWTGLRRWRGAAARLEGGLRDGSDALTRCHVTVDTLGWCHLSGDTLDESTAALTLV